MIFASAATTWPWESTGGERDAARALVAGEVDAACVTDGNHLVFTNEATLAPGATRVLLQTPAYDHCNFTALSGAGEPSTPAGGLRDRFEALLLAMSYDDPAVRPLLDLEGLTAWLPGRTTGYGALETAVDEQSFYDEKGNVTAAGYRP